MPSAFDEEDFYRLNEVLSALPPEERVQTGSNFIKQMGINRENGSQSI